MTIVKPLRLGLISRAQQEPPRSYFFVAALGYFDLLDPGDFDLDTKMWPMVSGVLGGTPIDVGMPKPRGEVLVVGDAVAPAGNPVTQMRVEFAVGPVRKVMTVLGDRHWELTRDGPVFTRALPFTRMPLTWDRAFGGPEFPANPFGTGHAARAALAEGRPVRLPNIEDAADLILDVEHAPRPVGCGYVDIMAPTRQRFAGTYDGDWLKRHHPGHAVDFDWSFYNVAPEDQWAPGFFTGDERIRIAGMHADHPLIDSRLPGMRVRAFANLERDGERILTEVEMRCETVVLFPGQLKGVVIFRGGCEVADIDGKDVIDTMLAYERLDEAPRTVEHYARTLKLRTDPDTAALSFFDEKPLRPDLPEVERAEREAERAAAAAERDAKFDRRMESALARAYLAVGALPPPPGSLPKFKMPVPIPVITPRDIERMDVDMVGVAAALKKLQAYGDQQIAMARQQVGAAAAQAVTMVAGAGGSMLDAAAALKLKRLSAALQPPAGAAPVLPADAPTLQSLGQDLAKGGSLPEAEDPFAAVLAAVQALGESGEGLSEEEKAVLRARAQGRPEGRITAPMVDAVSGLDLTAGGKIAVPDAPPPPDGPAGVEAFLQQLGLDGRTADAAKAVDGALAALGPQGGLVKPLLAIEPPKPDADAGNPIDALEDQVKDAAVKLEDAFAGGRRLSLEPLAPLEPLSAAAALYFGDAVRDCLAGGGDFRGRDWAGASLAGADFSGLDLRGAMFERADLAGARFRGAILDDAVFAGARLDGADLSNCAMRGANLCKAEATGASFAGSDLTSAKLSGARLAGADLSRVSMEDVVAFEVDLAGADLSQARFNKVVLLTSFLDGARLDAAEFHLCVFLQCEMNRLSARRTMFARTAQVVCKQREGDFTGADFTKSGSIGGAVYDGSIMRDLVAPGSGWHAASMVGVDLHAALLDGADLGKADLTGARLTRASLRRAVLIETVLKDADATAATFVEAVMRRVDLSGASLRNANLYRAGIDGTDLTCCDLTGVNAFGTNLMRAADVA